MKRLRAMVLLLICAVGLLIAGPVCGAAEIGKELVGWAYSPTVSEVPRPQRWASTPTLPRIQIISVATNAEATPYGYDSSLWRVRLFPLSRYSGGGLGRGFDCGDVPPLKPPPQPSPGARGEGVIPRNRSATPDPHQQLENILHRPEFEAWRLRQQGQLPDVEWKGADGLTQWLKHALRPIRDFLKWIFSSRSGGPSMPTVNSGALSSMLKFLAWAVVGVVAIFLAILLIRTVRAGPTQTTIANVLSREQVQAAMESGDALALGTGQWLDESRRLAAEQDFRAVYRALYLALLSGLHRAGKIEHDRNRTNWTYVRHYHGPAPERDQFSDLTELFDRVWYGRKQAEGSSLEQLRLNVETLVGGRELS